MNKAGLMPAFSVFQEEAPRLQISGSALVTKLWDKWCESSRALWGLLARLWGSNRKAQLINQMYSNFIHDALADNSQNLGTFLPQKVQESGSHLKRKMRPTSSLWGSRTGEVERISFLEFLATWRIVTVWDYRSRLVCLYFPPHLKGEDTGAIWAKWMQFVEQKK